MVEHGPRQLRAQNGTGAWYALAFFVCMAIPGGVFMLFLREGWALIHVPTHLSLPGL